MSGAGIKANEARLAQTAEVAADWVVRLQAPDLDEAQALDFDAWLDAHPANPGAYDAALSVMLEMERAGPDLARELRTAPSRRRSAHRGWIFAGGLAAAATVALAVMPFGALEPATQSFATAKGEHRTVKLADGSVIDLNAGSRLSVTLGAHERRVVLPEGEAVFDVAPDAARPFTIATGDRSVRVVGTRFDVRRRGAALSVTVERGVVEVRPAGDLAGRVWRLHPGQRLDITQGAPAAQLSVVDPQQVESWRSGRLIYRDQPLGEVVVDLNQQFAKPIVLQDPALGQIRVSGVLVLDDQDAVIRRLALLAPIKALPSAEAVLLRSDRAAKP